LRIGLVASPFHRNGPDAALFRLLRPLAGAGERRRPEQILSTALRRVDVARRPADAFDE